MEHFGCASDVELAERLRAHNPEQFHTLVRMHLSFLLDLSTDDNESGVVEKSWLRSLRPGWLLLTKKSRGTPRAGIPLTQETISHVHQLIEFLSLENNVCQEGIFRRSGSMLRQQELKQRLSKGLPLLLDQGHFSVHDCASVLKGFLAELPESLLTDAHYPAYCHIAELCEIKGRESRLLLALQLLLLLLPEENRLLLNDLLRLLHLTASCPSNKMTADSLATLFTPHLLCPRKLSPEEFHASAQTMSRVVTFMIQHRLELFQIPARLAVDVRAYWLEHHKRRLSQQRDGAEASTVFSFVDRELSVESSEANPTQLALAELYAHVQALPESNHKRRLLKQFQRRQPALSSSLASCIKRHVFSRAKRRCQDSMSAVRSLSRPESPGQEPSSSDCSPPLCGSLLRSRRSQSVVRQRRPRPRVTSLTYQKEASETMMTPRSRKPVLLVSGSNICHLAKDEDSGGTASAKDEDVGGYGFTKDEDSGGTDTAIDDLSGACMVDEGLGKFEAGCRRYCCADSGDVDACSATGSCSTCGGSLTSVFRSYLLSRSVLTASPVDLSFSSRTDDFDSSKEEAVTESNQLCNPFASSKNALPKEEVLTESIPLNHFASSQEAFANEDALTESLQVCSSVSSSPEAVSGEESLGLYNNLAPSQEVLHETSF